MEGGLESGLEIDWLIDRSMAPPAVANTTVSIVCDVFFNENVSAARACGCLADGRERSLGGGGGGSEPPALRVGPNRRFRDPWFALQVAGFRRAPLQIQGSKKRSWFHSEARNGL